MVLRVALSGGIGSGKSAVARFFAELNVPVIDADLIAHELTQVDSVALTAIVEHFGDDVLTQSKSLDRAKLRQHVFQNPEARQWLENLLHPLIRKRMQALIQQVSTPYCILVIPLLFEAKKPIPFIDRILVVDVPESLQIARVSERDDATREQVAAIMAVQVSRAERLAAANDVLDNSGNLNDLKHKVLALHEKYLELAK